MTVQNPFRINYNTLSINVNVVESDKKVVGVGEAGDLPWSRLKGAAARRRKSYFSPKSIRAIN